MLIFYRMETDIRWTQIRGGIKNVINNTALSTCKDEKLSFRKYEQEVDMFGYKNN